MEQVIFDFIRLEDGIVEEICRDIPVDTFSEKLSVAKKMNYNCKCSNIKSFEKHPKKQENSVLTMRDFGTLLPRTDSVLLEENPAMNVNYSEAYHAKNFNQISLRTVQRSTSNQDGYNYEIETEIETIPFCLRKNYCDPHTYASTQRSTQSNQSNSKELQKFPVTVTLSEVVEQDFVDQGQTYLGTANSVGNNPAMYNFKVASNGGSEGHIGQINGTEHYKFMTEIGDDLWVYRMKDRKKSSASSSTSGVDEDFDFDTECKAYCEDACSCYSSVNSEHNAGYTLSNTNYPYQNKYKNNERITRAGNKSVYTDSQHSELSDKVLFVSNEQLSLSKFTTTLGKKASRKADNYSYKIDGRSFAKKEQVTKSSVYNHIHIPQKLPQSTGDENERNCCLMRQTEENIEKDQLTIEQDDMYNDFKKKMKFGTTKLSVMDGRSNRYNENNLITGDSVSVLKNQSQIVQSYQPVLSAHNNFSYILDESKENLGNDNVKIHIDMVYALDLSKMNLSTENSKTTRVKIQIPVHEPRCKTEHSQELGQHVMKCLLNQVELNSEKLLAKTEESPLLEGIDSVTEYYV